MGGGGFASALIDEDVLATLSYFPCARAVFRPPIEDQNLAKEVALSDPLLDLSFSYPILGPRRTLANPSLHTPNHSEGVTILPMSGGVGAQYTPTVGYAHAIRYHGNVLNTDEKGGGEGRGKQGWGESVSVAHGGDGSVATNGFWAALNTACVEKLPVLFYIEHNGYAISTPSEVQTPGVLA